MTDGVVLGFDFGARRIGVAIGNGITRQARPLALIADAADSGHVADFCQQIIDEVSAGVAVNGAQIEATSSVGVAIFPADGRGEDELYKAADLALYDAKNSGRNTWRAFGAQPSKAP